MKSRRGIVKEIIALTNKRKGVEIKNELELNKFFVNSETPEGIWFLEAIEENSYDKIAFLIGVYIQHELSFEYLDKKYYIGYTNNISSKNDLEYGFWEYENVENTKVVDYDFYNFIKGIYIDDRNFLDVLDEYKFYTSA